MNYIGLLPEDAARREFGKLLILLGVLNKLRTVAPQTETDKVCLPIQKQAVKKEIRKIIRYLRKWKVNVKAFANGKHNKTTNPLP